MNIKLNLFQRDILHSGKKLKIHVYLILNSKGRI